jgi:hypothetical protein
LGETVSIDGTTLEANAAMRRVVPSETGESDQESLKRREGVGDQDTTT